MTSLNEILRLLNANVVFENIDSPIDEVINRYSYTVSENKTQKELISIISEFLELLKTKGILISMHSDESSEACWFIEKHYSDGNSGGYERAFHDYITLGANGIEMIVDEITESFKKELTTNYFNWIFDTKIEYLDWNSKLELLEEFRKYYNKYFSSEVSEMSKKQQIPFLRELLTEISNSKQTLL